MVSTAKKIILEGTALFEIGLNHDLKANYEYASIKYAEGLQLAERAVALVPLDSVVGKLLQNHSQAFSRRKDEIDFFFHPKTLFDFPTAPGGPPAPGGSVTTRGLTLV